jgi:hypothetical protein
MAIKKVVEIDVDVVRANGGLENFTQNFKKSEEAAKSLKTQLREAQLEVATLSEKFGDTSREAVEAAKRAAQLKDRIGDAKNLTEAFNPDAKFKALSGALTGVAGGFSVVTGLMGTLGSESKEVEGAILKVQSAMAIASGAQALGESIDSFKQLGAVVKSFSIVQKISAAAQMVWNAAMAANPIGAIVAVVVALIAAGYALVKMFIASSEATQKAEAANKALNKELDTQVKNQKLATQESDLSRDAQLKMAKASGKSAEEIRKLSLELANQEVQQKMANAQTLRAIAIEAMRVAGREDATEAEKETAKNALKEFNNANEALKASVLNRRKLIIDNRVAEVQEATDAREKSAEAQKKHNDELLANQKKANQERIDEFLRLKRAETDAANQAALDREKADTAFFDKEMEARKNNELSKMTEEEADLERVRLKYEADLEYAKKNGHDASGLLEQQENEINNIKLKYQGIRYANDEQDAENERRRQEEVARLKEEQYRTNLDNLQNILSAGGKKLAGVSKALAIADVIRSSYKSISETISSTGAANAKAVAASPLTGGQPFVAINTIQAALSIGANIASAARSIKAITSDSSSAPSGGGQTAGGGGGGGGAAPPPQFNIVGQSSTNQLSQTIAGQQNRPIQTYVVGNQVSTQQSLDRNAVATSTFG